MRIPKSLSYSSMVLWETNPEEFFLRYLAEHAAPRLPQEPPMAVGSSFDARVKSALYAALFGAGSNPKFEFEAIFESQVEEQCRDFARTAGQVVFDAYKLCGAYDELLTLLQKSVEAPRFEFKVDGIIASVPFTGKPDCRFGLELGRGLIHCILDWKVRGYCSKYATSPSKGYMLCRDGYKSDKPSRSHNTQHTNYMAYDHRGLTINVGYMEYCNSDYADQLCLYGWLLGEIPGDENLVGMIEEIVAKPATPPTLRIANHRARIKADYQQKLQGRVVHCWTAITTGDIFPDLTHEENISRCEVLEETALSLGKTAGPYDDWFNAVSRPTLRF